MFDIPKSRLVRRMLRVHNPGKSAINVCLEPWADSFPLAPNETAEIVFIGSNKDCPEIVHYADELTIYGWEGSEYAVLHDGQLVKQQPTIDEILRQEFALAKAKVRQTETPLSIEQIARIQESLDSTPELNRHSQGLVCELATQLIVELAGSLPKSPAAAVLLWQIASRVIGTRGLVLGAPDLEAIQSDVWDENYPRVFDLIRTQSMPVLPGQSSRLGNRGRSSIKRQRSESESGPTVP